jgi:ABC-type branched-subunit amino acid transport system ATPase component/ABC-type branched-subunit amino acid transport system permease subunit
MEGHLHRIGWIALAAAAFALPALTANTYYLYVGASVGLLTIVTAGLNVLAGFTGQISLGHAGFFAIGAYGAAVLTTGAGWHPLAATALALVLTALVGVVVGGAALRVSGPYLAMVTIAFGIIVEHILVEWVALTGGPGGIFNIPKPSLAKAYLLIAAVAAVALWLVRNLRRSPWGRAFLAIRASEVAAESLGLSAYFVRIVAFTASAAFAGMAGALFAFLNGYISPDSFTLHTSILYLLALLFGGMGYVAGPVAGSLVLTLLPEFLTGLVDYRLILYGLLLLVSMYWLPTGLIGALAGKRTAWFAAKPEAAGSDTSPAPTSDPPAPHTLLDVTGVGIAFGGVAALSDVSVQVPSRGIHAIIGPNGAGKTTLLNVLSGFYAPDDGGVRLERRPVHGRPPYAVARLGVARTFQTAQLFGDLTVAENVAVGVAGRHLGNMALAMVGTPGVRRRERDLAARAHALLARANLADWADRPADALPAGLRRRLEIVRALATRPKLLLLDEPAAGLGPAEIRELDAELSALRDTGGPAIVLVEHHMDLVMAISDRVTVLDYGRVIAEGAPAEVRRHPGVIEAYLGAAG